MPRHVAFLRGVSPQNARMADLRACFEDMGFTEVATVLASGNVVFTAEEEDGQTLAAIIEAGMATRLQRQFPVIVRSRDALRAMLRADPFARFSIPTQAKKVVTFLRNPAPLGVTLPMEQDGVQILAVAGSEVFTAYVASERGPIFMVLIEKTFGKQVTTRTWDTVRKCAAL